MKKTIKYIPLIMLISLIIYSLYIYNSLDGLKGFFYSFGSSDRTFYAKGYSDSKLKIIRIGMTKKETKAILGPPLGIIWGYGKAEYIIWYKKRVFDFVNREKTKRVKKGMSDEEVIKLIGVPLEERWTYSSGPKKKNRRVRAITFKKDRVSKIHHKYHVY